MIGEQRSKQWSRRKGGGWKNHMKKYQKNQRNLMMWRWGYESWEQLNTYQWAVWLGELQADLWAWALK